MFIDNVVLSDIDTWNKLGNNSANSFKQYLNDYDAFFIGFEEYMKNKIEKHEAFKAVDELTKQCLGIIAISKSHNSITFFAVFDKHWNKGIGTRLLQYAIEKLDSTKVITGHALRGLTSRDYVSRQLYEKFGFKVDDEAFELGLSIFIMKKRLID